VKQKWAKAALHTSLCRSQKMKTCKLNKQHDASARWQDGTFVRTRTLVCPARFLTLACNSGTPSGLFKNHAVILESSWTDRFNERTGVPSI